MEVNWEEVSLRFSLLAGDLNKRFRNGMYQLTQSPELESQANPGAEVTL